MLRKFSFQKLILLLAVLIFLIATFTWDISFNIQKDNNSIFDVEESFKKLENITWELLYSPDNAWLSFYENISNIDDSLKIQTYDFTNKTLKSEFKKLLDRWVDIKLIMENYKYQQFKNTRRDISNYFTGYTNFEIKSDEQMWTEYVHSKINLVDSGFWIQTANLTDSSFFKNREHFFYSENTWVRKSLNNIFEKDWNGEEIKFEDIHPNLVICNINCRDVIEYILNWADKSILIQTQYIVDDSILEILKDKVVLNKSSLLTGSSFEKVAQEWLDVRFVVAATETNDDLLEYFGPSIVRKFDQHYNHTKIILVDDEILLLWSMNLSDNSLDKNREIGILIIDKDIINQFKKMFEKDRENSKY